MPKLEKIFNWDGFINAGYLTCVLHGDNWSNNVMFRYQDNEDGSHVPAEMVMVDWQCARFGHPSIDF